MPFVDLLAGMSIVLNASSGISSLQLSRNLHCTQKTAFIMVHKIREAFVAEGETVRLSGDVEVDGGYFGGIVRRPNLRTPSNNYTRRDMRKAGVVIVARERGGRTRTSVAKKESDALDLVPQFVSPGSRLFVDGSRNWNRLAQLYTTVRINHNQAFAVGEACTNQAESFFARLRRMVRGQHGHVSPRYLHAYAAHAAWLEDHRDLSAAERFHRALDLVLSHAISEQWSGYWQGAQKGADLYLPLPVEQRHIDEAA